MTEASFPLSVIGLCHKSASLSLRQIAAARLHHHFRNRPLSPRFWPTILLSTCNRTEIYGPAEGVNLWKQEILEIFDDIQDPKPFYHKDSWQCFEHLSRVTCGLESAFFAETQIAHQVKVAYERAAIQRLTPAHHFAFQKALRINKSVRQLLGLSGEQASLESTLWNLINPQDSLLFVGASAMNEDLIASFVKRGAQDLTLANRTSSERAQKILTNSSIKHLQWQNLDQWPLFKHVFIATTSLHFLPEFDDDATIKLISQDVKCKNIFDLSVPCNASSKLSAAGLKVWNIDDLKKKVEEKTASLLKLQKAAEGLIKEQCQRHQQRWQLKQSHALSLSEPLLALEALQ